MKDPTITDGDNYKVVFENDRVRVLEYNDKPGDETHLHHHPDSVMFFRSSFKRKISANGKTVDVDGKEGSVVWLSEQEHFGHNSGETDTHVMFVELKETSMNTKPNNKELGPQVK